jgi:hypothetical protein
MGNTLRDSKDAQQLSTRLRTDVQPLSGAATDFNQLLELIGGPTSKLEKPR